VVVVCGDITGVPDFIDVDVSDIATVVCFVEGYAVWYVGRGFDFDHGKDCRVVVAV
jgi:hypothetical protein